jgi:hypothetical protein
VDTRGIIPITLVLITEFMRLILGYLKLMYFMVFWNFILIENLKFTTK